MGITITDLVSQVIVFLILLFALNKWVFPVFMKTLDQRANTIREGVENAERAKEELATAEQRVQMLLEQARRDSQETLSRATQAAERIRGEIEQKANERARAIEVQAQKRIEQEIAQARAELSTQIADLAIQAAERVIGQNMDSQTNRRLVAEFVAQAGDHQ